MIISTHSSDVARSPSGHARDARSALLAAGIASAVVYIAGDVVSGLLYDGYSFVDQAISELTAFGSPLRYEMMTVVIVHGLLVLAFGAGVLRMADRSALRWAGGLLMAVGAVGFPTHTVWAMSSRAMETGFNDTMHMLLTLVFSLMVTVAMVLVAATYRGRFRLYSLVTLAVMIGFGAASAASMRGLHENHTPWAGVFERIDAYAYLAWLVVLAVVELRRAASGDAVSPLQRRTRTEWLA